MRPARCALLLPAGSPGAWFPLSCHNGRQFPSPSLQPASRSTQLAAYPRISAQNAPTAARREGGRYYPRRERAESRLGGSCAIGKLEALLYSARPYTCIELHLYKREDPTILRQAGPRLSQMLRVDYFVPCSRRAILFSHLLRRAAA
jgi:hypothetical protein